MGDRRIPSAPATGIDMLHRAIDLQFRDGTTIELAFQDGLVKRYDMADMFEDYPQLKALQNRDLFIRGKLNGFYGVVWNDKLDIDAETVYEYGKTIRKDPPAPGAQIGEAVLRARAAKGWSQKTLAAATGIDQSDISKIERGVANPSLSTLTRIANALGAELVVSYVFHNSTK